MEDAVRPAVPGWFWIVAVLALLWEGMGCYAYLTQISAADDAMPVWVSAAFAVAVWVGVSGAILLLMRQRLARTAFAVSLLAVLVQFGGTLLVVKGTPAAGLGMAAAVVAAAVILLWFSDYALKRGWLS
jgi:hypothetical protein